MADVEPAAHAEPPLRAIIADDDPLARKMIKDALQRAGVIVIAEAHNGHQAVELTRHYSPDIVLMDVVMPELDGIAATRRIVKENPDQVIIILTTADDDDIGLLGLRAGARGFLAKDVDVDILPQAMQGALKGEAAISRKLSLVLVEHFRMTSEGRGGDAPGRVAAHTARVGGASTCSPRRRRPIRSPPNWCCRTRRCGHTSRTFFASSVRVRVRRPSPSHSACVTGRMGNEPRA